MLLVWTKEEHENDAPRERANSRTVSEATGCNNQSKLLRRADYWFKPRPRKTRGNTRNVLRDWQDAVRPYFLKRTSNGLLASEAKMFVIYHPREADYRRKSTPKNGIPSHEII